MKAFAYRFIRSSAEAILLLPIVMCLVPVTHQIFGIDIGQMLLAFLFLPIAISLGIAAQMINTKAAKGLLFVASTLIPYFLASFLHFGELAIGFAVILFFIFSIKHILFPKYYAPGIRLSVISIFSLLIYVIDIGMFMSSPNFNAYSGIINICAIATVIVAMIAICWEQIMLTGWYARQRVPVDRSVRRRNIVNISVFSVIVLGFSLLGELFRLVTNAYDYLQRFLLASLGLFFSVFSMLNAGKSEGNTNPVELSTMEGGSGGGEAIFASDDVMANFVRVLTVAVIIVAVFMLIKLITNIVEHIFSGISESLIKMNQESNESDQEEILSGEEVKSMASEKIRRLWRSLTTREIYSRLDTNAKRARFIYRRASKRTSAAKSPSATPREVCSHLESIISEKEMISSLRTAYEKARYGEKEPTDEEIKSIEKLI